MGPTDSGLDLETKIFSTSGRGKTFFLTSLFIELIERLRAGQLCPVNEPYRDCQPLRHRRTFDRTKTKKLDSCIQPEVIDL